MGRLSFLVLLLNLQLDGCSAQEVFTFQPKKRKVKVKTFWLGYFLVHQRIRTLPTLKVVEHHVDRVQTLIDKGSFVDVAK